MCAAGAAHKADNGRRALTAQSEEHMHRALDAANSGTLPSGCCLRTAPANNSTCDGNPSVDITLTGLCPAPPPHEHARNLHSRKGITSHTHNHPPTPLCTPLAHHMPNGEHIKQVALGHQRPQTPGSLAATLTPNRGPRGTQQATTKVQAAIRHAGPPCCKGVFDGGPPNTRAQMHLCASSCTPPTNHKLLQAKAYMHKGQGGKVGLNTHLGACAQQVHGL